MLLGTTVNSTGWVGRVAITTAVPSCLLFFLSYYVEQYFFKRI